LRIAFCWDFAKWRLVVSYRRFGTRFGSHLQGSSSAFLHRVTLKDGTDMIPRNVGTELPLYGA